MVPPAKLLRGFTRFVILPCLACLAFGAYSNAGEKGTDSKAEPAKPAESSNVESLLGDPLAAGKVALVQQEMVAGLKQRGIENDFIRFSRYAAFKLNSTSGRFTGSELTGNCRLSWYDHLLRNPIKGPAEAEEFSRELHRTVLEDRAFLLGVLATARKKLDLPERPAAKLLEVRSAEGAVEALKQALVDAQVHYSAALAPLAKSEISELVTELYPVMIGQNKVGHTLNDRGTARRLCDLMEKMDRDELHAAIEALAPLSDPVFLKQLGGVPDKGNLTLDGVSGRIAAVINTPAGAIVVGGRGKNTYRLDQMGAVACVIDLDGNDEYIDGVATLSRPVLVVIDLKGSDRYRGTRPGIQGSGLLGVSMLLDVEGNDVYDGQDLAQGSCMAGAGVLIDYDGSDVYQALRRVQGHALGGVGLVIDRNGDDQYRAAMWAQGFGAPLGFGLLDDLAGADHYFAGGYHLDSYPETPGMEGWSQGVGAGIRQVACGGIGVILDGGGDDLYEFDYIAHGGGYWCGAGFARDFGGSDRHLGSTSRLFNGSQRTEPEFQRFGNGFACHYAVGYFFDDSGDDVYRGRIMGGGFGWDCAAGYLFDFGGNDVYNVTGMTCLGVGAQGSLGVLFDYDGNDEYVGYGQGYASTSISYHPVPDCGGNFSFLIDYGGEDKYGCGANDNAYVQRGGSGGFLIDRPKSDSTTENETPSPTTQAASSRQ